MGILLLDNTNPEENFHRQFHHVKKSQNLAFGDLVNQICHVLGHLDLSERQEERTTKEKEEQERSSSFLIARMMELQETGEEI